MAKVVVLTYHYPPFNVIASQRGFGFARAFRDAGFETIVFTHSWENSALPNCLQHDSDEEEDGIRVLRAGLKRNLKSISLSQRIARRITRSRRWKNGDFETSPLVIQLIRETEQAFFNLIAEEKPDLVLGIFSPHFNLDWAQRSLQHGAKNYALDFRDLWDSRANTTNPAQGEQFTLMESHWKKWSAQAIALSTVSQPYADFLASRLNKPVISITNGFNEKRARIPSDNSSFTILHGGTVYPYQDLDPVCQMARKLKDRDIPVLLDFIGVKSQFEQRLLDLREKYRLGDSMRISGRVPVAEAQEAMSKADLLFFPCWQGHPGFYTGKIFDYISADVPILALPSDDGVVEELIEYTNTGKSFHESQIDEAASYVMELIEGRYEYASSQIKIDEFSRSAQCAVYVDLIKKMV